MQNYPAFYVFAIALVALFIKTALTSVLQVLSRIKSKRYLLPEDAGLWNIAVVGSESLFVQRCANVQRNDTENVPLFLALALTYVLLGASVQSAQWLFFSYVAIRYLHTVIYLRGVQPWRIVLYLSGMAVCWTIAAFIAGKLLA
ncbi:MAG: MAPEG family protein [Undibacterium sp.]|nr:MAPEG family protein [Undibacterium sp.]